MKAMKKSKRSAEVVRLNSRIVPALKDGIYTIERHRANGEIDTRSGKVITSKLGVRHLLWEVDQLGTSDSGFWIASVDKEQAGLRSFHCDATADNGDQLTHHFEQQDDGSWRASFTAGEDDDAEEFDVEYEIWTLS